MLIAPALWLVSALTQGGGGASRPLRGGEIAFIGVVIALAATGTWLIVKALRSKGPRGTRVGRTVLDDPERVFSVKAFQRDIRVNGIPVRKVHVVAIAIDQGDELELHLQPNEIPAVMDALKQAVGPNVIST
jgi:hypothetical protein